LVAYRIHTTGELGYRRLEKVEAVAAAVGRPIAVELDPDRVRPEGSEVDRLWADNTRARKLTGWSPEYGGLNGFERGIAETVEWFADPANRASGRSRDRSRQRWP
jgi:dTDP-glucose 4,6-dehydratase